MSTRALTVWMQAHQEALHEPLTRRLRVEHRGRTVAETDQPVLVWEPRRIVPAYAVPVADVKAGLHPAPGSDDLPGADGHPVLHPGIPFRVHSLPGQSLVVTVGADQLEHAAFRPDDPHLAGHVILDFTAFDAWFEEDEQVLGHPQDPFKQVRVRRSTRHVRVEVDGETVAESREPRLLFETGLPTRYYLPAADVRTDLLRPTGTHTWCAYKGQASYWTLTLDGRPHRDLVWSYPEPLHDATPVQGMLCFLNERVDLVIDGVRQERPSTIFG